jgi:hypothetical protein
MAAYAELYIDQGSTFNNVINLIDDVTNSYVNVSSYVFKSQLRKSYYSANASANITCTITDVSNGEVTLSMTAANTANLKPGRYLYDVEFTDAQGNKARLLEGIVTVTPEISKD